MIAVEADVSDEWPDSSDWPGLAERAVQAAVAASDYADLVEGAAVFEVSVKFTSDEEVRLLNGQWRAKDKPTNVLSFPMLEPELIETIAAAGEGEALLGDIVLARGICASEAQEKGVEIATHAAHLIVHGTLHLLGYDHETGDEDAEDMEQIEREALAAIGIADPYHLTEDHS
jgi:probable rRNA maturation factor